MTAFLYILTFLFAYSALALLTGRRLRRARRAQTVLSVVREPRLDISAALSRKRS